MSYVSYAQNFEDVMLMRALQQIDKGFYIDVGAWDPSYDSVTRAFYERGWHGVNVEPVTAYFNRLESARPRDINIQALIGAESGEADFYVLADSGLSTMSRQTAERHAADNGYKLSEAHIPVRTLTEICLENNVSEIHFLKIDVEGAEQSVIEGLDLASFRPWIILAESTLPNTQQENHQDWEPILLNAAYEFVYFDGLNRFYIAEEHSHLKECFRAPPNVFDFFECSETQTFSRRLTEKIKHSTATIEDLTDRIQLINRELDNTRQELDNTRSSMNSSIAFLRQKSNAQEQRIRNLEGSLSWRITKPLRTTLDSIVRLKSLIQGNKGRVSSKLGGRDAAMLKRLESRDLKGALGTGEIVKRIYEELDAQGNDRK